MAVLPRRVSRAHEAETHRLIVHRLLEFRFTRVRSFLPRSINQRPGRSTIDENIHLEIDFVARGTIEIDYTRRLYGSPSPCDFKMLIDIGAVRFNSSRAS